MGGKQGQQPLPQIHIECGLLSLLIQPFFYSPRPSVFLALSQSHTLSQSGQIDLAGALQLGKSPYRQNFHAVVGGQLVATGKFLCGSPDFRV